MSRGNYVTNMTPSVLPLMPAGAAIQDASAPQLPPLPPAPPPMPPQIPVASQPTPQDSGPLYAQQAQPPPQQFDTKVQADGSVVYTLSGSDHVVAVTPAPKAVKGMQPGMQPPAQ